jgi:glycine/serine hydroxymethyltransferase
MDGQVNLASFSTARTKDFFTSRLSSTDAAVARAIGLEMVRQRDEIELIASENIVGCAVLDAAGSVLTDKYAEGCPGRRYYGGCHYVDIVEQLAIERACKLFDCTYANVQPNSGSQANQAIMLALIETGDTILGLSLDAGGHLTHGARPNMSGTSGIRLGTPAGTTRGFGPAEFSEIARMITAVFDGLAANDPDVNDAIEEAVKIEATRLCRRFPIYGDQ